MRYIFLFFLAIPAWAQHNNKCEPNISFQNQIHQLSQMISTSREINGDQVSLPATFDTKKGETITLIFNSPKNYTYTLHPNSWVILKSQATTDCSPKLQLRKGKITSDGHHQENSACDYEIETPSFYLNPVGTRYTSSVELSQALADLDFEMTGYKESVDVNNGSVEVKLVKLSDKSKIKKSKKSKVKATTVAKLKDKKLKLGKGSKLVAKIKKSKTKKDKVADLDVLEP